MWQHHGKDYCLKVCLEVQQHYEQGAAVQLQEATAGGEGEAP